MYAGEDFAVVEYVGRGTHEGTFRGPAGEIPPTGRHVELLFREIHCFRDGKIFSTRSYFDVAGMMAQLGLLPSRELAEA